MPNPALLEHAQREFRREVIEGVRGNHKICAASLLVCNLTAAGKMTCVRTPEGWQSLGASQAAPFAATWML